MGRIGMGLVFGWRSIQLSYTSPKAHDGIRTRNSCLLASFAPPRHLSGDQPATLPTRLPESISTPRRQHCTFRMPIGQIQGAKKNVLVCALAGSAAPRLQMAGDRITDRPLVKMRCFARNCKSFHAASTCERPTLFDQSRIPCNFFARSPATVMTTGRFDAALVLSCMDERMTPLPCTEMKGIERSTSTSWP